MQKRQTIAIIGAAGKVGKALSIGLSRHSSSLLLFDEDAVAVHALVEEIKALNERAMVEWIDCAFNASWEADVILIALPADAGKETAEKIREVAGQKVVIRMVKVDHVKSLPPALTQQTEIMQQILRYSRLATIYFTTCPVTSEQADILIATNDEHAGQTAFQLMRIARLKPRPAAD